MELAQRRIEPAAAGGFVASHQLDVAVGSPNLSCLSQVVFGRGDGREHHSGQDDAHQAQRALTSVPGHARLLNVKVLKSVMTAGFGRDVPGAIAHS